MASIPSLRSSAATGNVLPFGLALLLMSVGMLGCNSTGVGPAGIVEGDASTSIWDAGILIPGRLTSVLFPLDHPSVECAEDILSIASSCDCTTAEPCDYWTDTKCRRVGIRVHMFEEDVATMRKSAAQLAVLLTIKTHSGEVIERSVRVLVTLVV